MFVLSPCEKNEENLGPNLTVVLRPRLVGTSENSPSATKACASITFLTCMCQVQDFDGETLLCALSIDLIVYIWSRPLEIVL